MTNRLLPLQKIIMSDYLNNKADIYVLSGGRGSSKSHVTAGIFAHYVMSQKENSTFGMGLARISNFYEQMDELLRKAIGNDVYKIGGQSRDVLIFPGNRRVQLFSYSSVGQIAKLRGKNFSGIFLEEITLCPQNIYNEALLSTRQGDTKVFITTNPVGQSHWVYRLFFDHSEKQVLKTNDVWYRDPFVYKKTVGDKRVIIYPSMSYDNSDKNGGFIRDADIRYMEESLPSLAKRRLIYGEWIDAGEEIYNINELKYYTQLDFTKGEVVCVIDPSYSGGHSKGNFTSILLALVYNGEYFIIDTGLVKNNSNSYTAKTVGEFISIFEQEVGIKVNRIYFESVMSQNDTLKALRDFLPMHDIIGFQPKGNKIERMIAMETVVKSRVYFNDEWKTSPRGYNVLDWTKTRQGRGYIGLVQLISFDGIDKGRKYESELSMHDFPDALASLIQLVKSEVITGLSNGNKIAITQEEILKRLDNNLFNNQDDAYSSDNYSIPID